MGLLTLCVSNTVHCYAGYRIPTMEIALMIEGQDGLTWPRWQRLAAAAEELGCHLCVRSCCLYSVMTNAATTAILTPNHHSSPQGGSIGPSSA